MKVYICSPYSGDTETNIRKAQQYCKQAIKENHIPIAPHLYFPQFLDDEDVNERAFGMMFAKYLLLQCDEVWVCGKKISKGMTEEIALAKKYDIPIKIKEDL